MPFNCSFSLPNHTVFRLLLPLLLMAFTACEKVLDIDLKDAEPRQIIEANLSDQVGPNKVIISRSVNFNAPNTFPMVSGAQVTISDNAGNSEDLVETEPGVYETITFKGEPGRTYVLKITLDGVEYSAISTMPQPVAIQRMKVEPFQFDPTFRIASIEYQDPAGIKNFYRIVYSVNDTLSTQISIASDEFNDGKLVDEFLDRDVDTGDSIHVKLLTIDENVFRFRREQNQLGNSQAASPANPRSTFTNGALGYFSAHAESSASIVVP